MRVQWGQVFSPLTVSTSHDGVTDGWEVERNTHCHQLGISIGQWQSELKYFEKKKQRRNDPNSINLSANMPQPALFRALTYSPRLLLTCGSPASFSSNTSSSSDMFGNALGRAVSELQEWRGTEKSEIERRANTHCNHWDTEGREWDTQWGVLKRIKLIN